jgi:hypothetical protein
LASFDDDAAAVSAQGLAGMVDSGSGGGGGGGGRGMAMLELRLDLVQGAQLLAQRWEDTGARCGRLSTDAARLLAASQGALPLQAASAPALARAVLTGRAALDGQAHRLVQEVRRRDALRHAAEAAAGLKVAEAEAHAAKVRARLGEALADERDAPTARAGKAAEARVVDLRGALRRAEESAKAAQLAAASAAVQDGASRAGEGTSGRPLGVWPAELEPLLDGRGPMLYFFKRLIDVGGGADGLSQVCVCVCVRACVWRAGDVDIFGFMDARESKDSSS